MNPIEPNRVGKGVLDKGLEDKSVQAYYIYMIETAVFLGADKSVPNFIKNVHNLIKKCSQLDHKCSPFRSKNVPNLIKKYS